jgi:hypothetical protein
VDSSGNVLIADIGNNRIRRVDAGTGVMMTVAGNGSFGFSGDGGPATSAMLGNPVAVAVIGGGYLLIADTSNHRLRRLALTTVVSPSTTATPTPTPSTSPYCAPSLFRLLPRMDLVGSLVGTALSPREPVRVTTDAACRQECCDAPACDGYTFDASSGRQHNSGECYLYVNVTQLVPSSTMASGVRESVLL